MGNHIRQGGLDGDTPKRQSNNRASLPWISLILKGEEAQSGKEKENEEKRNAER